MDGPIKARLCGRFRVFFASVAPAMIGWLDLGAVVGVCEPDGVELVTASGKTEVDMMLPEHDVRPVDQRNLIAVRPVSHTAECFST